MQTQEKDNLSATRLLESLDVGDRVESTRAYSYLNFQRSVFHRINPDRRVILMKSKFKKGVTIIMRAE